MTYRVADSNEDYTGSATHAFTIGRRAAAVKPKNAYYAPAVKWAADNGVTEGIGGGLFGPNNDCTRADRHVPLPALREGVGAHEDTYIIKEGSPEPLRLRTSLWYGTTQMRMPLKWRGRREAKAPGERGRLSERLCRERGVGTV